MVGSVHGCTSSTLPIARSGHRCAVFLAVPRGEFVVNTRAGTLVPMVNTRAGTLVPMVNTRAGTLVPIALSIGLGCQNPAACRAHALVVGRRTRVYKHCS